MRFIGSPILIATFLVAPVSPALHQVGANRLLPVSVAEAVAISYGNIKGSVILNEASSSPIAASEVAVNLYLNESDSYVGSTVTDVNGIFAFTGIQGITYRVEISPSVGFGFDTKSSSTAIVSLDQNNKVLSDFNLTKLPAVKMFGPSIINLTVGEKFEDPGVIFQKFDGTTVTGYGIDGIGKVDTNIVGKYTITYHVDDKATNGYPTIDAVRTINVLPKTISIVNLTDKKSGLTVLPTANTKVYLNSYLGKSYSNDKIEVLKLQAFLFFKEGFVNVKATGVYDAATELAVRNFQDRYFKEILTPWGTEDNTGEVRMMTLRKINDLYNGVNTPLTIGQESTLALARNQSLSDQNKVAVVNVDPVAVVEEVKPTLSSKISSWWKSAKKSLIAAFPSFDKDDKEAPLISASGSVSVAAVADIIEEPIATDNLAAAKVVKTNKVSNTLIFFATVFALIAFVVAVYIYRKTRGPVLVTVEEEVEEAISTPIKK